MANFHAARFRAIYDKLPSEAQQKLVEAHLIPLLDRAPKRARRVLASASHLRRRHQGIPILDLRAKKADINFLFEELNKDSKRSYVTDSSQKPEILTEVVSSLTDWLSDIWSVVFEHGAEFALAHECLLFICNALTRLASIRSCCKCSLTNMYIPVTLRSKSGRIVKTFHIDGAHNLERVVQFIWRDMFLSMLVQNSPRHRKMITHMLADIESAMNSQALVRVLSGGGPFDGSTQDDDATEGGDSAEEDNDDGWVDDDSPRCRHWTSRISDQLQSFRLLVQAAMKSTFEACPSLALYNSLIQVSTDSEKMEADLFAILENVATSSSDIFAVTLEIYALECQTKLIVSLLDSHSYLLRPRDARSLQMAVKVIATGGHSFRALAILEAELLDAASAIRRALNLSFSQLDAAANKTELLQILQLRQNSVARRDRIEAWVDAIQSPGANVPNPMLFAAMMMGMPPIPGMTSDDDPYTYLDLDPLDPDLEDLRHEHRPNFKQRFEGWTDSALVLPGGQNVLLKAYKQLIDSMPFLRATDATEEMIARLSESGSKQYVCDGLDALLAFVKIQRRKWNVQRNETQKRKAYQAHWYSAGSFAGTSSRSDAPTGAGTSSRPSTSMSGSTSFACDGVKAGSSSDPSTASTSSIYGDDDPTAESSPVISPDDLPSTSQPDATPGSPIAPDPPFATNINPVPHVMLQYLFGGNTFGPPPVPQPSLDDVD